LTMALWTIEDRVDELTSIGEQLIAALAEESAVSLRASRDTESANLHRASGEARRHVEHLRREYFACLERLNYPDLKIRKLIETPCGPVIDAARRR
jgi:hypothetical protein